MPGRDVLACDMAGVHVGHGASDSRTGQNPIDLDDCSGQLRGQQLRATAPQGCSGVGQGLAAPAGSEGRAQGRARAPVRGLRRHRRRWRLPLIAQHPGAARDAPTVRCLHHGPVGVRVALAPRLAILCLPRVGGSALLTDQPLAQSLSMWREPKVPRTASAGPPTQLSRPMSACIVMPLTDASRVARVGGAAVGDVSSTMDPIGAQGRGLIGAAVDSTETGVGRGRQSRQTMNRIVGTSLHVSVTVGEIFSAATPPNAAPVAPASAAAEALRTQAQPAARSQASASATACGTMPAWLPL
jgi:hypothetical protein